VAKRKANPQAKRRAKPKAKQRGQRTSMPMNQTFGRARRGQNPQATRRNAQSGRRS